LRCDLLWTRKVSGNTSTYNGGGIENYIGSLTVKSSAVSSNTSGAEGGGIYNNDNVRLNNSTVSDNRAGTTGGGIYTYEDGFSSH
jgi:predicted outer membrane repeat protein